MKNKMKLCRVLITPGEPAGIGPDIVIQLMQHNWPVEIVVCADDMLLQDRAALLGLPLDIIPYEPLRHPTPQQAGTLTLLSVPLRTPVNPGQLNAQNSLYVIETLIKACNSCLNREFAALITGPVHKGIINKAGILFTGHTEFLERYSHNHKVVMMLVSNRMRVALVTTHIPIKEVSDAITSELLCEIISVLHFDLRTKLGIPRPRILVCGLNPHAGENGYIGTEEIDTIIPALEEMRSKDIIINGPLPADSIFQSKYLDHTDVVLAMYHDQGLPVLKYHGFGNSVNITLGLPFIRTSVDHGTALDLVGQGKADIGSLVMALNIAIEMIHNIF